MSEKCIVCKKGYIQEETTIKKNLIWKQEWKFIDCTNKDCQIHKTYLEKCKRFNENTEKKS